MLMDMKDRLFYRVKAATLGPSFGEIFLTICENAAAGARSHDPSQYTIENAPNEGPRVAAFTLYRGEIPGT